MENFLQTKQPVEQKEIMNTFEASESLVNEQIHSIDENIIKDIIKSIARKSGNESAMSKFIPFQKITLLQPEESVLYSSALKKPDLSALNSETPIMVGGYDFGKKTIKLDPYMIFLLGDNNDIGLRTFTLSVLIHEELHALTDHNTYYNDNSFRRRVGFNLISNDKSIPKETWEAFNEGLTELIRDQIFEEYLKRNKGNEKYLLLGDAEVYRSYRFFVNEIIKKISELSGVNEDVVFESLVQAYFSREDYTYFKQEIEDSLNGIGGDALVQSMHFEDRKNELEKELMYRVETAVSTEDYDKISEVLDENRKLIVEKCSSVLRRCIV